MVVNAYDRLTTVPQGRRPRASSVRPLDFGLRQKRQGLEDRKRALLSSAEGMRFPRSGAVNANASRRLLSPGRLSSHPRSNLDGATFMNEMEEENVQIANHTSEAMR